MKKAIWCLATLIILVPVLGHAQGLSAEEIQMVDQLIAPKVNEVRNGLVGKYSLPWNILKLSLRRRAWQAWQPAMKVGWFAQKCREAHVPLPQEINERLIDDIIWQYDNAYGSNNSNDKLYHQAEVVRALGFIGHPRAIPTIKKALTENRNPFVWQGISELADPSIIPYVEKYLDFRAQQNAFPAISALEKIGEPSIPLLGKFIAGTDRALQRRSVEALQNIESEKAIPLLERIAEGDENSGLRRQAETAIAIIRSRQVDKIWNPHILPKEDAEKLDFLASEMFRSVETPGQKLDKRYIDVFVALGVKGLPLLRKLIVNYSHIDGPGGPHWIVTPQIADIMVQIGPKAVPCLVDTLNDQLQHAREYAAEALKKITGRDFGLHYGKWKTWYQNERNGGG